MIDILIPTYNRENTILETIESALNQQKVEITIHVVDNNSGDSTIKLINETYGALILKKKLIVHEFNETVQMYENWNRCLNYIKSKYFKLLFSDDILDPMFCFNCYNFMENNPTLDLVATDLNYFKSTINDAFKVRKYNKHGIYYGRDIIFRSLISRNNICAPSNSLIKSSTVKGIKFKNNRVASDWIYFVEALTINNGTKNYGYIEKPLSYFRTVGDTETNNLKMSSKWVIQNFEARNNLASNLNFLKRIVVKTVTSLYCTIVLCFIKRESSDNYLEAKFFLEKNSSSFKLFYPLTSLILKFKFVRKYFLSK
jgi:glycosyltransferase involved in cell wall biosynthesis